MVEVADSFDYEKKAFGIGELSTECNLHFEQCIHFFYNVPSGRIIDVGCGGGQFLCLIKRYMPDYRFFGVDISKTAVKLGKARNGNDMKIHYGVSDAEALPFQEMSAVSVLAFDVLEHIPGIQTALKNIHSLP